MKVYTYILYDGKESFYKMSEKEMKVMINGFNYDNKKYYISLLVMINKAIDNKVFPSHKDKIYFLPIECEIKPGIKIKVNKRESFEYKFKEEDFLSVNPIRINPNKFVDKNLINSDSKYIYQYMVPSLLQDSRISKEELKKVLTEVINKKIYDSYLIKLFLIGIVNNDNFDIELYDFIKLNFGVYIDFELIEAILNSVTLDQERLIELVKMCRDQYDYLTIFENAKNITKETAYKIIRIAKENRIGIYKILVKWENISTELLEDIIKSDEIYNMDIIDDIIENPNSTKEIKEKVFKKLITNCKLIQDLNDIILKFSEKQLLTSELIGLALNKVYLSLNAIENDLIADNNSVLINFLSSKNLTEEIFKKILDNKKYFSPKVIIAIMQNEFFDADVFEKLKIPIAVEFFKKIDDNVKANFCEEVINNEFCTPEYAYAILYSPMFFGFEFLNNLKSYNFLTQDFVNLVYSSAVENENIKMFEVMLSLEKNAIFYKIDNQSDCSELPKIDFDKEYLKTLKKYLDCPILEIVLIVIREMLKKKYISYEEVLSSEFSEKYTKDKSIKSLIRNYYYGGGH